MGKLGVKNEIEKINATIIIKNILRKKNKILLNNKID